MSPLQGKKFNTWNYRVVKRELKNLDGSTEIEYGIHECHYEPTGWTQEPVAVDGESVEALRDILKRMMLALDMEVIDDTEQMPND